MAAPSPRLQFRLGTLLVGMTLLAIACGFVVVMPVEITQLLVGLIWIVATSILLVGLFFGRGDQRAFCIGASVVVSSMWTGVGGRFMQGVHYVADTLTLGSGVSLPIMLWLDLAVLGVAALGNGWVCVRARAFFEQD